MNQNNSIRFCYLMSFVFAIIFASATTSVACPTSVACQDGSEQEGRSIEQWILQLSDPLPANREKAESAILAIGDAALPAIERGLQEGSLEIHDRCQILRQKIEREKRDRVSKQFLDPDAQAAELIQFEAWPHFKAFIGNDDVSHRELFLDMCQSIPSIFKDFGFKSDLSALALKKSARMTLVPDRHHSATASVLMVAHLFLADLAEQHHAVNSPSTPLFNEVEILEAVNFISNSDSSDFGGKGAYRAIVDAAVAKWVGAESVRDRIPAELKWNLIYQSKNLVLIDQLEAGYDSFSTAEKLKFLDVLSILASDSKGKVSATYVKLLAKPMEDDSEVLVSRYRKRPAQTVELRVQMLAEAIAAKALHRDSDQNKKIELEKIFGSFPLSGTGFLVLKDDESRQMLSQQLLARKPDEEQVE